MEIPINMRKHYVAQVYVIKFNLLFWKLQLWKML